MGYEIHKQDLNELFKEYGTFYIAAYQRRYSWTLKQINALLDDIDNLLKQDVRKREPHFFGNICVIKKDNSKECEVVDGQQRLTSITLLMKVIYDQILSGDSQECKIIAKDRDIRRYYLNNSACKLETSNYDQNQYKAIIQNRDHGDQNPYLSNAIRRFNKYAAEKKPEALIEIAKLIGEEFKINRILFDNPKDVYKLFEIINNRGLPLTQTDLIKNFIFGYAAENCSAGDLKTIEDAWSKITQNFDELPSGFSPDVFFRQYLLGFLKIKVPKTELAEIFKIYFNGKIGVKTTTSDAELINFTENDDIDDDIDGDEDSAPVNSAYDEIISNVDNQVLTVPELIHKISVASEHYKNIINSETPFDSVNKALNKIERLKGIRPSYILFLNLLQRDALIKSEFGVNKICQIIWSTEVYLFRHILGEKRSQKLDAIFSSACRFEDSNIFDDIENHFRGNGYLSDEDFTLRLPNYNFNNIKKLSRAKYILEIVETLINRRCEFESLGEIEMEHIIPESLAKISAADHNIRNWSKQLGVKWRGKIGQNVYRIGNLSLLEKPLNGDAHDKLFVDKLEFYGKSKIKISKDLCHVTVFSYDIITERAEKFSKIAAKHWKLSEPKSAD